MKYFQCLICLKDIKRLLAPVMLFLCISLAFPNRLTVDGNTLTDAKGISNAFNKYFASVGPMLANGIQPGNRTFVECI